MSRRLRQSEKLQERILDYLRDAQNPTRKRSDDIILEKFGSKKSVLQALEMLYTEDKVSLQKGSVGSGRRVTWLCYNPHPKISEEQKAIRLEEVSSVKRDLDYEAHTFKQFLKENGLQNVD